MYYDILNTILFLCQTGGFECAREYNKWTRTVPPNLREWCCQSLKWRTVTWNITYVTIYGFIPGIPSVWASHKRSHNYDNSAFYNSFRYLLFSYSFGKLYRSVQFLY